MKKITSAILATTLACMVYAAPVYTSREEDANEAAAFHIEALQSADAGDTALSGNVVFSASQAWGRPGDTVTLQIAIEANDTVYNSIGIRDFVYDESALTFEGLTLSEDVENNALFPTVDNDKKTIAFGYMTAQAKDIVVGTVSFKINSNASDGDYSVSFTPIAKNSSTVLGTEVVNGSVKVQSRIWGDIDNDNDIDIDDAILLFQHSMMPDIYPID